MKLNPTSCVNPVWGDAAHTHILCTVTFAEYGDVTLPFSACPTDPEDHGRQLWGELHAGKYGVIAPFVTKAPPAMSTAPGIGPRDLG